MRTEIVYNQGRVESMADEAAKDPAAQALAHTRWKKTPAAKRSQIARELNKARWKDHVAKRPASSRKKKSP